MHALDRNLPNSSLREFRERLPIKPYFTDQLGDYLSIHRADVAVRARYIQPNGPTHQHWLVFDIDRPSAAMDWEDRCVPPPNFTAQNPVNGHAHLFYGLATPVRTAPDGRIAPLRYAAAIQGALGCALDGDTGYRGFLCKNPLNDYWRTHEWEPRLYELGDFEGWLDLSVQQQRKAANEYGLGRNTDLFERLRQWAYRAIRQGWPDADRWYKAVEERARAYNSFDEPLNDNEVKGVARSVAKYTHRRFSELGFSAWQAEQGRKGGKAKGAAYADKRAQALALIDSGASQSEVAKLLGVHRNTVRNWVMHK